MIVILINCFKVKQTWYWWCKGTRLWSWAQYEGWNPRSAKKIVERKSYSILYIIHNLNLVLCDMGFMFENYFFLGFL